MRHLWFWVLLQVHLHLQADARFNAVIDDSLCALYMKSAIKSEWRHIFCFYTWDTWCVRCYCVLEACWQIVYALPVILIRSPGNWFKMLVARAIFLVTCGQWICRSLAECSLTEVYFAASQQIRGTSGIRFFVGASDWDFFGQIGRKSIFCFGNGSHGNYRKRPEVGPKLENLNLWVG